jgi:hypothetical protein
MKSIPCLSLWGTQKLDLNFGYIYVGQSIEHEELLQNEAAGCCLAAVIYMADHIINCSNGTEVMSL